MLHILMFMTNNLTKFITKSGLYIVMCMIFITSRYVLTMIFTGINIRQSNSELPTTVASRHSTNLLEIV